jgi:peroxiredoxin
MRKMLLSVAVLALIVTPAMAGKFNKKLSVGDKAPDFSGIPA